MSAMEFREPNQALWRGARPGHNGVQVVNYISIGLGTYVLHTTDTGKTFFLNACVLTFVNDVCRASIEVTNSGDTLQYRIIDHGIATKAGSLTGLSISFPVPLEIPAGWIILCRHFSGAGYVNAFIHGWEE